MPIFKAYLKQANRPGFWGWMDRANSHHGGLSGAGEGWQPTTLALSMVMAAPGAAGHQQTHFGRVLGVRTALAPSLPSLGLARNGRTVCKSAEHSHR